MFESMVRNAGIPVRCFIIHAAIIKEMKFDFLAGRNPNAAHVKRNSKRKQN